jgi:hypothetical protein
VNYSYIFLDKRTLLHIDIDILKVKKSSNPLLYFLTKGKNYRPKKAQQSQWKTVLLKQLFLGAIFLTPASENALKASGVMCILSIILIFGASNMAFGGVMAHCIAQIASGRMYINDR